jgi:hypothetical protein
MAGSDHIREQDPTDGMNAVATLGRIHTLPDNRQLVLRRLYDLDHG